MAGLGDRARRETNVPSPSGRGTDWPAKRPRAPGTPQHQAASVSSEAQRSLDGPCAIASGFTDADEHTPVAHRPPAFPQHIEDWQPCNRPISKPAQRRHLRSRREVFVTQSKPGSDRAFLRLPLSVSTFPCVLRRPIGSPSADEYTHPTLRNRHEPNDQT